MERHHEAVVKILADLTDRKGLRQAWDSIDDDIQDEIKEQWADILAKHYMNS